MSKTHYTADWDEDGKIEIKETSGCMIPMWVIYLIFAAMAALAFGSDEPVGSHGRVSKCQQNFFGTYVCK